MKDFTRKTVIALMGIAAGLALAGLEGQAHTPCDDSYIQRCQYVQVINPYNGKLETEYVCE